MRPMGPMGAMQPRPAEPPLMTFGEALTAGWHGFRARLPLFAVLVSIPAFVQGVMFAALNVSAPDMTRIRTVQDFQKYADTPAAHRLVLAVVSGVVVGFLLEAFMAKLALAAVRGDVRPFGVLAREAGPRLLPVFMWAVVVRVVVVAAGLLCFLPGLAVYMLCQWIPFLVVERVHGTVRGTVQGVRRAKGTVAGIVLCQLALSLGVTSVFSPLTVGAPVVGYFLSGAASGLVGSVFVCAQAAVYTAWRADPTRRTAVAKPFSG